MTTSVIPADIIINEEIVALLIAEQFGLTGRKIRLLGEGFDNAVYRVDDNLVFRFPRRQEAVSTIEREIRILPLLENHLSIEIPKPIYIGQPSPKFDRIFYGHQHIKGQSGCAITLSPDEYQKAAADLGHFLKDLHSIDVKTLGFSSNAMEPLFDRADFNKLWQVFKERIKDVEKNYNIAPYQNKITEICHEAKLYKSKSSNTFIHGDLYHRHIIFNEKHRLSGVIDWGDSAIGDPIADLAIVFQFLPKFAHQTFFSSYKNIDQNALAYARFLGIYYAMALLWFGHDRKDQDLIRTSLWTMAEI